MTSVPKFGMKVPRLWCDSHTTFKVKRSKVKVTRPINADTHRAPYLPNGKAYELHTWYMDGGRGPASATGAMISKVKGQGRKVTWSIWAVLTQCCTCVIRGRGGIPCRPNPAATLLVIIIILKVANITLSLHDDKWRGSRWRNNPGNGFKKWSKQTLERQTTKR